jgi:hypothetical protein
VLTAGLGREMDASMWLEQSLAIPIRTDAQDNRAKDEPGGNGNNYDGSKLYRCPIGAGQRRDSHEQNASLIHRPNARGHLEGEDLDAPGSGDWRDDWDWVSRECPAMVGV